jgi:DNA-directed RNA polymerase alpha subunit
MEQQQQEPTQQDENQLESRLPCGVSVEVANALRRVIINETPCYAAAAVHSLTYTADMPLEVLAERLALVPIAFPNTDLVQALKQYATGTAEMQENATLTFQLKAECKDIDDCDAKVLYKELLTRHLTWMPNESQNTLDECSRPRVVHQSIPLVQLRPGQAVDLVIKCVPGTGNKHAKWSVACPATYRYLTPHPLDSQQPNPQFGLHGDGRQDQKCIEELVNDPDDAIIFSLETTGAVPAKNTVLTALTILKQQLSQYVS